MVLLENDVIMSHCIKWWEKIIEKFKVDIGLQIIIDTAFLRDGVSVMNRSQSEITLLYEDYAING